MLTFRTSASVWHARCWFIGLIGILSMSLRSVWPQDLSSSPKVGGVGSMDSLPGSDGGSGRHRLSTLAPIPEDFATLKLSPGFLLSMDVYDAPELSSDLRVDESGDVTIAMIRNVHVAGETLIQAALTISQRLRVEKILNDPHINLNILQYASRNVTILGEVRNPGRIELLAPRSLADVIAMSGGETQYAGNTIELRHSASIGSQRQLIHYSRDTDSLTLEDTMVQPGDTIMVRRAGIVYVLGGVNRPGGYIMQEGGELNLTQALALAYGTNMQAAVSSIHVIRKLPDGNVEDLPIRYRDMVNGKASPLRLLPEDVIYVPISKVKTILGQALLATAAQAVIYLH